jgi:hypothetical protein
MSIKNNIWFILLYLYSNDIEINLTIIEQIKKLRLQNNEKIRECVRLLREDITTISLMFHLDITF